jgi:hypothetical protein
LWQILSRQARWTILQPLWQKMKNCRDLPNTFTQRLFLKWTFLVCSRHSRSGRIPIGTALLFPIRFEFLHGASLVARFPCGHAGAVRNCRTLGLSIPRVLDHTLPACTHEWRLIGWPASETLSSVELPVWRNGRRTGLKILGPLKRPCRFESDHRHHSPTGPSSIICP